MSLVRVLVVDDFESWRNHIVFRLRGIRNVRVICEASDGLDAVQKAEELKPDLILLDLGLPVMNGMAAARQIRWRASKSRLLFISQESDPDVVREALRFGIGFLTKADAGREFTSAVKAVIPGDEFLSSAVRGVKSGAAADTQFALRSGYPEQRE